MHLSWSQIRMLMRCPKQWEYRYVKGVVRPPGVALVVGAGTHRGVEVNMRNKLDEGEPMPLSSVLDVTRDAVITRIEADGLRLTEDEKSRGLKTIRGEAVDQATALSALHHTDVAPNIDPVAVEKEWELNIGNEDKSLKGRIDIETAHGIRDTKTSGKMPPKGSADKDDQLTMYALAYRVLNKRMPEEITLDYLVKSKEPRATRLDTTRTIESLESFLLRIETAFTLMESGVYMPCDRSNWWCGPRWCGYYDDCPYTKE